MPSDFGLNYKDYYADVVKVVNHMRYAVQMEKSNPRLAEVAGNVKAECWILCRTIDVSTALLVSILLLLYFRMLLSLHKLRHKFPVPEKGKDFDRVQRH